MTSPLGDRTADLPGDLLGGRFRLGDLLGVGGSASVFEAVDVDDPASGPVAVKLLHPHLCDSPEARADFLREAEVARTVRHENLTRVHAAGVHEAAGVWTPWLAVELVAGGSVAERVRERGPLDVLESVAVTRGVLAALGALHAAGYVHRDVTPGNVLLAGPRSAAPVGGVLTAADVRLADFGTADASGRVALARAGGGVVGTAAFISPEQAAGLPVRAAADLYQAGALLYFMLTGQPPFPRATPAQVVDAHLSAPPPVPSALARDARPLDRIVTRAMTKTPARRFRDAEEFSVALAEVGTLLSPAALPHADTSVDADRTKVLTTTTDPRPVRSNFPPFDGAKGQSGSDGVAGYVSQDHADGAITYVEYSYAKNAKFPVAKVLNKAGYYIEPTASSVAVALTQAKIASDLTPEPRRRLQQHRPEVVPAVELLLRHRADRGEAFGEQDVHRRQGGVARRLPPVRALRRPAHGRPAGLLPAADEPRDGGVRSGQAHPGRGRRRHQLRCVQQPHLPQG